MLLCSHATFSKVSTAQRLHSYRLPPSCPSCCLPPTHCLSLSLSIPSLSLSPSFSLSFFVSLPLSVRLSLSPRKGTSHGTSTRLGPPVETSEQETESDLRIRYVFLTRWRPGLNGNHLEKQSAHSHPRCHRADQALKPMQPCAPLSHWVEWEGSVVCGPLALSWAETQNSRTHSGLPSSRNSRAANPSSEPRLQRGSRTAGSSLATPPSVLVPSFTCCHQLCVSFVR